MDSSWDNKSKKKIAQANNIRFKEIIRIDDVKKEGKKTKTKKKKPTKNKNKTDLVIHVSDYLLIIKSKSI